MSKAPNYFERYRNRYSGQALGVTRIHFDNAAGVHVGL